MVSRLRWVILGLLFAATAISYIDRQTLSVIAPVLRDELGITNSDYAFVLSCFLFAYTVMQAAAGWLIDRFGTRFGFAVIMLWWSVATMLHALGDDVTSFAIYRVLLGAGEAGSWAACVKAVAEWFPARERGMANSLWGFGVSVGQIVSVPLVAWITIVLDWRLAFVFTGLIGFIWLIAWLRYYHLPAADSDPPAAAQDPPPADPSPPSEGAGYLALLKTRNVWVVVLIRVLVDPCIWFYNYWIPTYLSQGAGFSMADIGKYAWIPFTFQGAGLLLGGFLSDLLCRRGRSLFAARFTIMMIGIACAVPAFLIALDVAFGVTFMAICMAMLGFGLWAPNVMTLIGDAFPNRVVGTVTGLSGMGAGFGGMLFMLVAGRVIEAQGFGPMFVAAAVIPISAVLLLYFGFSRRPEAMAGSL
ncbi:MFS transporter [Elongatibacter sediminis]|uniref:MFS transporter n=1 Tax=Elongatibacter sediminis TaxID=3119006 RepID=A0AAW9RJL8_9GAMM